MLGEVNIAIPRMFSTPNGDMLLAFLLRNSGRYLQRWSIQEKAVQTQIEKRKKQL